RLPGQRLGHLHQPRSPWRRPYRQITITQDIVRVKELLAAHVLVARGHIAFADVELVRPPRDGVLVVTDQSVLALKQIPGAGPPAEGINLVPRQAPPPTANGVTVGTTQPARQQR